MKNLFLASLVSFISFQSFSQTTDAKNTSSNFNIGYQGNINTTGIWIPGTYKQNFIGGSVYLFPNFNGQYTVISKNGESRQLFNLNFNLITKTLESLISKDSVFQYNLEQFDYVISSNNKYKVNAEGDFIGLSLEVYNSPKIQFLKDVTLTIEKGVVNPMTQTMISEDKYVQFFTYYLILNNNRVKIKLSKSDILKQLIDKKDALKEFASKNDLSFSKEDDVNKILKYYDSL
jgi:hypothetical protein